MVEESYILYIEDERPTIDLVYETLKFSGFKMVGATNGEEGLATMRTHKPDLLLLDLMMPGLSGTDVYREMKHDETLADIPVIVVSAKVPDSARTIVADLPPVHDYILKPFDLEHLIRSVRHVVLNRVTTK